MSGREDRARQAFHDVLDEIDPAKGYAESCGLKGGKLASPVHIKLDLIAGYAREGLAALATPRTDAGEVERLREALERIAANRPTDPDTAQRIAKDALSARSVGREGWKLVPIQPTIAILEACSAIVTDVNFGEYAHNVSLAEASAMWSAMLAAAPSRAGA